jgi:enoyl-CoA hydratase/carnithine racemase
MSDLTVLAEQVDSVLLLTLNRPERLNAWTTEMEELYCSLLEQADRDPDVRAIVVTGAGRGFCAGTDMQALAEIGDAPVERPARPYPSTFPLTVRKPLIAAINGACAGLGFVHAVYCDVRFASSEAKLTTSFARRGLVAEHGVSWLLPRIVGASAALDLLMSARVLLGSEAERIGLVNRATPPEAVLDTALDYARDLAANCSPTSMAAIKAQVRRHLASDLEAAVAEADELMERSFTWPDVGEGVASYVEHRAPAFPPLTDEALAPR